MVLVVLVDDNDIIEAYNACAAGGWVETNLDMETFAGNGAEVFCE